MKNEKFKGINLSSISVLYNFVLIANIRIFCVHLSERCIMHGTKDSHNVVGNDTCVAVHSLIVKLDLRTSGLNVAMFHQADSI